MKKPTVTLKPLEVKDIDNVMDWVNDPEIIGNFANFSHTIPREEEKKFIEKITKSESDKVFSVFDEEKQYLGQVGLHQIHWPSRAGRLAIIIGNKKQRGKGYAQAALKELLKLAFEEYNLHKAWIITFQTNKRMRHIMKKLGFQKEGTLREEYYNKGKYHDVVRMSILDKEYFAGKEASK